MIRWKFGWHSWNVNGSWSLQMWQYCMFSLRKLIVIHTCMISQKSPESKAWHSYWCKIIYFQILLQMHCLAFKMSTLIQVKLYNVVQFFTLLMVSWTLYTFAWIISWSIENKATLRAWLPKSCTDWPQTYE